MTGPRPPIAVGQTVVELGIAAAASSGFASWGVLPTDDPFYSSLLILPLVGFALRMVERAGKAAGGNRLWPRENKIELVLLGLVLTLILNRQRLDLPGIDHYLAVGLLLLLASRIARLVVAFRPILGRRLPTRPALVFFFLPWVVYLALQPWMSERRPPDGDEPYNLLLTHSLAFDFDLDLANNYQDTHWRSFMTRPIEPQIGDPRGADGEIFSRHNAFLPLVLSPIYRLAGLRGVMAFMAALTALAAWMVLRLAASRFPDRPGSALLAYALFAFSPPAVIYSYQVWVEVPAALFLVVAFDRLHLGLKRGWGRRDLLIFVFSVAALPLLKLRLALVAVPLGALAVLRSGLSRSALGWAGGAAALVSAAVLASNQMRYGNPLKMHRWSELTFEGKSLDAFAQGAIGVFFDSAFGLFAFAPIWWLILPATILATRRSRPLLLELAGVATIYNLALWPRLEWYGGWAPPFRYPFLFLPLLALILIPLFDRRKEAGFRIVWGGLLVATLTFSLLWVVFPGWTYNFADGRSDWLDALGRLFGADVARFFPSTVRPRAATWVWLGLSIVMAAVVLLWRQRWRYTSSLGLCFLLVLIGLFPFATRNLPTRVVEVEDVYVQHRRTIAFPETWTMQRSSARAGRQVKHGGKLELPVVSGGSQLEVVLVAKTVGPQSELELSFMAGGRTLGSCEVEQRDWYEVSLGPWDWPAGESLVIVGPEGDRSEKGGVMIDRVELQWQRAKPQ